MKLSSCNSEEGDVPVWMGDTCCCSKHPKCHGVFEQQSFISHCARLNADIPGPKVSLEQKFKIWIWISSISVLGHVESKDRVCVDHSGCFMARPERNRAFTASPRLYCWKMFSSYEPRKKKLGTGGGEGIYAGQCTTTKVMEVW